jgi:formamidopyrimidine-DNA glycosylase
MPELPEVETVRRALEPFITGSTIMLAEVLSATLRTPLPQDIEKDISFRRIISVQRRAKYLLFELNGGVTIVIHLGMTGRLILETKSYTPIKHDHFILRLDNNKAIVYNDPRRFGLINLIKTDQLSSHKLFINLGPEPLSQDFTVKYLKDALKAKKTSIKMAIMDSRVLVGVGNIYANEILFLARISPIRRVNDLNLSELEKIVRATKTILKNAIDSGGSSIRDFLSIDSKKGGFQNNFAVYSKVGQVCQKCSATIVKIYQGGRSTFFCPKCQC